MQWIVAGPPEGQGNELTLRPQVLSWDKAGSRSQERLVPYRREMQELFKDLRRPFAFHLRCGLAGAGAIEFAGDLDNFLVPVGDALGWIGAVSAWGSKSSDSKSFLLVGEPSNVVLDEQDGWRHHAALTTESVGTVRWKQQLAGQLSGLSPVAEPFVELVIRFGVGPRRQWRNLWKPTIDSLGAILGQGYRQWHPRDGRIVTLGLNLRVDETVKNDVALNLWWRGANEPERWR